MKEQQNSIGKNKKIREQGEREGKSITHTHTLKTHYTPREEGKRSRKKEECGREERVGSKEQIRKRNESVRMFVYLLLVVVVVVIVAVAVACQFLRQFACPCPCPCPWVALFSSFLLPFRFTVCLCMCM